MTRFGLKLMTEFIVNNRKYRIQSTYLVKLLITVSANSYLKCQITKVQRICEPEHE